MEYEDKHNRETDNDCTGGAIDLIAGPIGSTIAGAFSGALIDYALTGNVLVGAVIGGIVSVIVDAVIKALTGKIISIRRNKHSEGFMQQEKDNPDNGYSIVGISLIAGTIGGALLGALLGSIVGAIFFAIYGSIVGAIVGAIVNMEVKDNKVRKTGTGAIVNMEVKDNKVRKTGTGRLRITIPGAFLAAIIFEAIIFKPLTDAINGNAKIPLGIFVSFPLCVLALPLVAAIFYLIIRAIVNRR